MSLKIDESNNVRRVTFHIEKNSIAEQADNEHRGTVLNSGQNHPVHSEAPCFPFTLLPSVHTDDDFILNSNKDRCGVELNLTSQHLPVVQSLYIHIRLIQESFHLLVPLISVMHDVDLFAACIAGWAASGACSCAGTRVESWGTNETICSDSLLLTNLFPLKSRKHKQQRKCLKR